MFVFWSVGVIYLRLFSGTQANLPKIPAQMSLTYCNRNAYAILSARKLCGFPVVVIECEGLPVAPFLPFP